MARQVRDANLETRNARRRLKVQSKPYWAAINQGLHVGYRKRGTGGTWIARRLSESGKYKETRLGTADDFQDADNITVLDFVQAQDAARKWSVAEIRKEQGIEHVANGKYTVEDAIRDYLSHYAVEGKGLANTKSSINTHILPALGTIEVTRLTAKRITEWHHNLAAAPARLRTKKTAEKKNTRAIDNKPDAIRGRRATANRVLTILKAALNYAWKAGKIESDIAWRKVKPFKNVEAPVIRYLKKEECTRLVNACPPDFREMVQGALFTGCRYAELANLIVSDFNKDSGTILIKTSKSGKPRHVVLTEEGRAFFESVTTGKAGNALIFTHDKGAKWGTSHQSRPLAEACKNAKIEPAISFHILRHTHGGLLAMQGVPMPVIAQQLGHSDTRMTEKHYAHLSPSYVAETIRQHFPTLGLVADDNKVEQFKPKKQKSGNVR